MKILNILTLISVLSACDFVKMERNEVEAQQPSYDEVSILAATEVLREINREITEGRRELEIASPATGIGFHSVRLEEAERNLLENLVGKDEIELRVLQSADQLTLCISWAQKKGLVFTQQSTILPSEFADATTDVVGPALWEYELPSRN